MSSQHRHLLRQAYVAQVEARARKEPDPGKDKEGQALLTMAYLAHPPELLLLLWKAREDLEKVLAGRKHDGEETLLKIQEQLEGS